MSDEEIWKPVPGFDEVFASSLGRISRLSGKERKRKIDYGYSDCSDGYLRLKIKNVGHRVHRLVALAFHPNPTNLPLINHKNGVKTDNRPDNLEWCDGFHNMQHGVRTGLIVAARGEAAGPSELTEQQVRAIFRAVRVEGKSQKSVAAEFGVSKNCVWHIVHGDRWQHLGLSTTEWQSPYMTNRLG